MERAGWVESTILAPEMTTWVFSDVHGVRSGLLRALQRARLVGPRGGWRGPRGTQLVGLGDYIDRGGDSLGVLRLLWRLEDSAARNGSRVVLLRGNHEELLMSAMMGDAAAWQIWLSDFAGGEAFLRSLGADPANIRSGGPRRLRLAVATLAPELYERLRLMPEWAIWGSTFLAHAGLPPHTDLDSLTPGGAHIWQEARYERGQDPDWSLDGPAFAMARREGIERVVYGHLTQPGEVKLDQDGRALCLDTNAAAVRLFDHPHDRGAAVTLSHLTPTGPLGASDFIVIGTADAPDRARPSADE